METYVLQKEKKKKRLAYGTIENNISEPFTNATQKLAENRKEENTFSSSFIKCFFASHQTASLSAALELIKAEVVGLDAWNKTPRQDKRKPKRFQSSKN